MTLDWGDGVVDTVAFAGSATAFVSVTVSFPSHAYSAAATFRPTLTVTDPAGHGTTVTLMTVTVAPALLEPSHYPRLSGIAQVGRTLTCLPGPWGDPAARIRFRWLVDDRVSYGHTSSRFRLAGGMAGRSIFCRVTVSNAATTVVAESGSRHVRLAPRPHRRHRF